MMGLVGIAMAATAMVTGRNATPTHLVISVRDKAVRRSTPTTTSELPVPTIPPLGLIVPPTEPTTQPPPTTVATIGPPRTVPPAPRAQVIAGPISSAPAVTPETIAAPEVRTANDPSVDINPWPNFLLVCSSTAYDDSFWCVEATLAAIDNARQSEGLGSMTLPSNWPSLTPTEQLFVATNLERTARGLAPLSAMASSLDAEAAQAADGDQDPSPPSGFPWTLWGGNWAGQVGNPLEAVYYWMYDDGLGSSNESCSPSDPSGCWVHRRNVLLGLACSPCVMGAGWATAAQGTSLTEILVDTQGSPASDFTWEQEQAYLP